MKKNLLFATLFVAGAATAGFAQFVNEENNVGAAHTFAAGVSNLQDTTKPVQDTTKPVKDSVPPKKDSTSFNF